jgi:DsbE subfamily thiol:disulfide oxidoreductase
MKKSITTEKTEEFTTEFHRVSQRANKIRFITPWYSVSSVVKFLMRILPVAVCLFSACTARAQNAAPSGTAKAFDDAGLRLLKERVPPRDFSLSLLEGETKSLSSYKGKVVFLNFWATWCGPCRIEMPSLEALYNKFSDKGLEILAVNCREDQATVSSFLKNEGFTFPVLLDLNGRVSLNYGIQAIPTTFLIDRDGMIILRLVGSTDWDTSKINAALESLLSNGL